MAIRIRDGCHIVYWHDQTTKKRREKSFGRGPGAKDTAEEFDKSLGLGKTGPKREIISGPTMIDIIKYYRDNHVLANDKCAETFKHRAKSIIISIGKVQVVALKYAHLDRYVRERMKTVKNSTINREINDIQSILNFAVSRKRIVVNPLSGYPKLPNDDEIIIPPTADEISAIYAAASGHIKRFILFCTYVIARPGAVEVLSVRWRDVGWGSMVISIVGAAKNKAKEPRRRQAPIQPAFLVHLKRWHDADRQQWGRRADLKTVINYKGAKVKTIRKAWVSTLERAGIRRRLNPYSLRHRSITEILDNGGDIQALSEIAGSSPATLMKHYRHVSKAEHRKAASLVSLDFGKD